MCTKIEKEIEPCEAYKVVRVSCAKEVYSPLYNYHWIKGLNIAKRNGDFVKSTPFIGAEETAGVFHCFENLADAKLLKYYLMTSYIEYSDFFNIIKIKTVGKTFKGKVTTFTKPILGMSAIVCTKCEWDGKYDEWGDGLL